MMAQYRSFMLAAGIGAWLGSAIAVTAQDRPMPPGAIPGVSNQPRYQQPYQPQHQQPHASQPQYQQPQYQHQPLSQACVRLESQLASIERGPQDPARAAQIQRYEDAINKQQTELDRNVVRLEKTGCESSGFFSLFRSQPEACGPLRQQVQRMRDNIDRMMVELQQVQGNTADRESRRRSVLVALGENNCGPQYRAAVANQRRGLFESLFGPGSTINPSPETSGPLGSTYTTICVRSCDGYYWPISFSTVPAHFSDDARVCQRMCPAAPASLYTFHNPGETVDQAISLAGQPYTALPAAFSYRKQLNPACSCRNAGESWAQALGVAGDDTVQSGDIVVTADKAKQLSEPPELRTSRSKTQRKDGAAADKPGDGAAENQATGGEGHKVRNVGPTFLPSH